jgi:CRP-like cAMP-binding protein
MQMTIVNHTFVHFILSPPMGVVLTHQEREAIQSLNFTQRHYPAHTVISRQGDVEPRRFVINSGWGCIYRDLANGDRQIIDVPLKGDIFGIRTVDGPNWNSFASITELSVFEVSGPALGKMLGVLPGLSNFLMRSIARQNSIVTEHLTNAGRRNALVRTGHYLLELAARLASIGEDTELGYDCPLTQHELADALGLTAIHVNRTLRELREHDLVSFRSGFVEFLNRSKLAKISGFDKEYLRIS